MMKGKLGSAFVAACAVAALILVPVPALAQTVDKTALTECLVTNTTDSPVAAMKRLIIAAVRDDVDAMKIAATNYDTIIGVMVIMGCGIPGSQLTDPAVKEVVGAYGQKLGEKIMIDAFAKIGQ